MSELALLTKLKTLAPSHPWVTVGPGDDCAVLDWKPGHDLAFKIDQVIEGTHFTLTGEGRASPAEIGWKAMAKACSDIAAMGFWPVAATVAVYLPKKLGDEWALSLNKGLTDCCEQFKFALAGGDLATGNGPLMVTVSMLGKGPADKSGKPWLRSGAREGDLILVTGDLGGSLVDGGHLKIKPRLVEAQRIRTLAGSGVHACIDITDGLSRDLMHIGNESACGAVLWKDCLPISQSAEQAALRSGKSAEAHVLADGEDFELLLSVDPSIGTRLLKEWDLPTPLRKVGKILTKEQGFLLEDAKGTRSSLPTVGWEHETTPQAEDTTGEK